MTVTRRADNFGGGPAALPLSALQAAQAELLDFAETGMSILEVSHRSREYEELQERTSQLLKQLLSVPDGYDILFLQGGASLQFAMLPMNFLPPSGVARYVLTGSWSEKALAEAAKIGAVSIAGDGRPSAYRTLPSLADADVQAGGAYLHLTSNNTIFGTQWRTFPDAGDVPVVADMSSDILARALDIGKFHLIYAGAQKNLGPAGVTVVIVRSDWLTTAARIADQRSLPAILQYSVHAKHRSLYNTPPVFAIWMTYHVLQWLDENGGIEAAEVRNLEKANLLYNAIDSSDGFYAGYADSSCRSRTNVTFRLPTPELEAEFLSAAAQLQLVGLAGHRSVGGCRASLYNAVSLSAVQRLVEFMAAFRHRRG